MKHSLNDGSFAHLLAIIQNREYRMGYRQPPPDATEEILRIAKGYLPKDNWRSAPLLLIGQEREGLNDLLCTRKLPEVLCVGLFYSVRGGIGKDGKASYLYVVWLQNDFIPHMSAENQTAFAQIQWPENE